MTLQFIAEADITVVVRSDIQAIYNEKGQMLHPKKQRLFAKFRPGIPGPFLARAQAAFPKWDRPERPLAQFGGYLDTDVEQQRYAWDDEEKSLVEAKLMSRSQVIHVEIEKAALPYPAYAKHRKVHGKRTLDHAITDIKATLDSTGLDPELVVAYECDHEDENSMTVVAAVQAPLEPEPKEELVAA